MLVCQGVYKTGFGDAKNTKAPGNSRCRGLLLGNLERAKGIEPFRPGGLSIAMSSDTAEFADI
jgi:hypothetical protein